MTNISKNELRQTLEELVDKLVAEGASHNDACRAVTEEVAKLQAAYDRDPDPAEDVVIEEPANDWPAADLPRPSE